MSLIDGTVVQGDGSSNLGVIDLTQPALYVIRGGKRHLISNAHEFRHANYDRLAVQVLPDADLEALPLAMEAQLAPGGEIVLDLNRDDPRCFLGAGHYMTTWGV
jgi:hypothetical protein